jgi:streptogramin lyase
VGGLTSTRAIAAAAATTLAFGIACSGDVIGEFPSPPSPAITSSPTPKLEEGVLAEIPIGGSPCAVAEAGGSVWITAFDGNELDRVDPATNEVTDTYPMPDGPCGMTERDGVLWIQTQNLLVLFDPVRGRITDRLRIPGGVFGLTQTTHGFWGLAGQDELVQIDPATKRIVARVKVEGPVGGLAVSDDGIWTASGRKELVRIDPGSRSIVQRIPVEDFEPEAVATDGRLLWVSSSFGGEVLRIDAKTGKIRDRLPVADSLFGGILVGGDYWVSDSGGSVFHLDGRTGEVVREYERVGFGPFPAAGNLWTVDFLAESAFRLDEPAS